MSAFWFFLSRTSIEHDVYVDRFFEDLKAEVRLLAGTPEEESGFLDTQRVGPADVWWRPLSEALPASRVFVPLLSPNYFRSEACGRQWEYVLSRSRTILPVVWLPFTPDIVPRAVTQVQYLDSSFPEVYQMHGLRYLMKSSRHNREYEEFLEAFAARLFKLAARQPTPAVPEPVDLSLIPSAFEPVSHPSSPRTAGFMYLVANRAEIREVRTTTEGYSETKGRDWQPFYPQRLETAGQLAMRTAAQERFSYEEVSLDAEDAGLRPLVILVDPWTALLKPYQKRLRQIDATNSPARLVTVLWNSSDRETVKHRKRLEDAVHLWRRNNVESLDEFRDSLSTGLQELVHRILLTAVARSKLAATISMPTIGGPGGKA